MDILGLAPWQEKYTIYKKYNHEAWQLFEQGKIDALALRSTRFDRFFNEIDFEYAGLKANNQYLDLLVDNVRLIAGALALLKELESRGVKMIIITNGLKEVQKPRIEKMGMTRFFMDIIVSDEIGYAKPDARFFKVAERAADYPDLNQVLVVGDSLTSDIAGGNNYGYDTCWYNPHRKKPSEPITPKHEINTLNEVLELL